MINSFLGIPIDGDIVRSNRKDQRPLEEFSPILQAVLDDTTIVNFGWHQYTPYFNDGDPCIFRANCIWVRTDADNETDDGYDLEVDCGHPTIGRSKNTKWEQGKLVSYDYEGPDKERFDRCLSLSNAISSGEFDNVLLGAFGDHAEVTISNSGIKVEFYEHD